MAVPKYNDFYNVVLDFLSDGEFHNVKDCQTHAKIKMQLTAEELSERTNSGGVKWAENVSWCLSYLKKFGMISNLKKGQYQITDAGRKLLSEGILITNEILYERTLSDVKKPPEEKISSDETPEDIFERIYCEINADLSEKLLNLLMKQSPQFFEQFTVKLMEKMGYGIGEKTQFSGDGGIDGIIYGDKLGFDRIGIQAKLWSVDKVVGRPEIQKFFGALASSEFGKIDKGLFVTTAKFSDAAKKYADVQHIILIDVKKLAELMIEFDVGVSTQKIYKIKRSTRFFSTPRRFEPFYVIKIRNHKENRRD